MDCIVDVLVKLALKSNMKNKYGCIIVERNRIIATGYNYYTRLCDVNQPYENNKYSIHAEKDALFKVKNKNRLKYCFLYVIKLRDFYKTNFNINYIIENGIPCHKCQHIIEKYNITVKNVKILN